MDTSYSAFISYRHHPEDIKVAEQIQRCLEHYRIPKEIRRRGKKISRVFRDKEELPITSNISDDIYMALKNSEYLIVICSVHTRESTWVQREIETFLKFHDHSKVLTVIVNGEPYETIPEILLHRQMTDPVTGKTKSEPIEPLSCDWRIGRKKAKREELPRLAAALLGCGYDELRQRERQYRIRRMVAVFSASLIVTTGLMSYFIYTSIQIQNNLRQAQISQSKYLASSSLKELEEGDRLLAMQLALEALPKREGQRPYVARAERALGEAEGLYSIGGEIRASVAFTFDVPARAFKITDDGKIMYAVDERNELSVWDLETDERIVSTQLSFQPDSLTVTGAGNVVAINSGERIIACYDRKAELLWQTDGWEMALSDEKDVLLLLSDESELSFLNPDSGKEIRQAVSIRIPEEEGKPVLHFLQESYDLRFPVLIEYRYSGMGSTVLSVDSETGNTAVLDKFSKDTSVRGAGTADSGEMFVSVDLTQLGISYFNGTRISEHGRGQLRCYDADTARLKWTAESSFFSWNGSLAIESIGNGRLLWQQDDYISQVDISTGEVLGYCQTPGAPISVTVEEDRACLLLQDGSRYTYIYEYKDQVGGKKVFKDDIVEASYIDGAYYVRQRYGTQILRYVYSADDNWKQYERDEIGTVDDYRAHGNLFAIQERYGGKVYLFDSVEERCLWTSGEESGYTLMDFSEDGSCLWVLYRGEEFIRVDSATAETKNFELTYDSSFSFLENYPQMDGDLFYFTGMDSQADGTHGWYVLAWNSITEEMSAYKICTTEEKEIPKGRLLCAQNGTVYVWESVTEAIYKLDVRTGESSVYREGVENEPFMQFLDSENTVSLCLDNEVELTTSEGRQFNLDIQGQKGLSCALADNNLFVLTDKLNVISYDVSTGKKKGTVNGLNFYSGSLSSGYKVQWKIVDKDTMFLNADNAGNLIRMDQLETVAFIPQCIGYLPYSDQFISREEKKLYAIRRYRLVDMKIMAGEVLRNYTLTPEQKEHYGLD